MGARACADGRRAAQPLEGGAPRGELRSPWHDLAEQPALEREVVVKVLREDRGSPEARERFLREARLAAQLRHPYAAQVYASGAADGGSLLWIAMELVQGVSLADWLAQHGRMSPERFVPFFDDICQVVHAAHDKGIVHRDLKPSNIMVVECEDRLPPSSSTSGSREGAGSVLASSVERGFDVRELSADKAYLSNENLVAVEAAHAVPYIPFKNNSRGTGRTDAWRRLWHMFEARNDEFLAHYHKRSNVESTFSMVKRKFGASVRA